MKAAYYPTGRTKGRGSITPDPVAPLVEAIAVRVAELLAPRLSHAYTVKPRLLTVAQTAVYLSRSEKSIRHLAASEALCSVRADDRVMFDIRDLDRWIELNKHGYRLRGLTV